MNKFDAHILVVDDDKDTLFTVGEILRNIGCEVSFANNGAECLTFLKKSKLDLILLDIMMPEMDGFEVAKIVRNTPKIREIPLIFITAKTDEESIEKGFEVGGNDYITKPFKQRELLSRINTQLKLKADKEAMENLLLQQSKMAKMGEIIDSVAHQWKQPLNVINIGASELEMNINFGFDIDNDMLLDLSKNIQKQVAHLLNTLEEFRSFLRPDKPKEKVNIAKLIESVFLLLKDDLTSHSIKTKITGDTTLEFNVIVNEFKHIFINLLTNARDAFIENKIENREVVFNILEKKGYVSIEVTDNAGGIPKSVLADIFKANVTTKAEGKGTGIGLYMSMQIAEKFNAKLIVDNRNSGACFSILF